MRFAWHSRVFRVAEDGGANLFGPALFGQYLVSDEGMFLRRGIFFVVEVMEQSGNGIPVDKLLAEIARHALRISLALTIGAHARLNGEGVFQQAGRLRVLAQ